MQDSNIRFRGNPLFFRSRRKTPTERLESETSRMWLLCFGRSTDDAFFHFLGPDIAYLTPNELVLVLKPLKVTTVHLPAMINKIQVVAKKSDTAKKNRYTFLVITNFETTSELFRLISNIRQSVCDNSSSIACNNKQQPGSGKEARNRCSTVQA
ncbi:hypothetical protein Tco_0487588 [Tanacetum coccineum]